MEAALTPRQADRRDEPGRTPRALPARRDGGAAIANSVAAGGSGVLQGTLKSTEGKSRSGRRVRRDTVHRGGRGRPAGAATVPARSPPGSIPRAWRRARSSPDRRRERLPGLRSDPGRGKVASHFVHHWPDRAFKVITKQPLSLNAWHRIAVTYDGLARAPGCGSTSTACRRRSTPRPTTRSTARWRPTSRSTSAAATARRRSGAGSTKSSFTPRFSRRTKRPGSPRENRLPASKES